MRQRFIVPPLILVVSLLLSMSGMAKEHTEAIKSHQPSAVFLVVDNKTQYPVVCGQQAKMTRGHVFFMGNAANISAKQHSDTGFDGIFATADATDHAVGSFHCSITEATGKMPADMELFFEYGLRKATMGNLLTSIKLSGFAQVSDPYKVTVKKSRAFRAHIDPPHIIYTIEQLS
ncbi:MAG: hypothetical protein ACX932_01030 [Gammaproteobacteria bacterium]